VLLASSHFADLRCLFYLALSFLSCALLLLAPVSSVLLPCCHLPLLCLSALLWAFSVLKACSSLLCAAHPQALRAAGNRTITAALFKSVFKLIYLKKTSV
jgi:hypothetical protein